MFWICAEHRVDHTEVFASLLSRACTETRTFCLSLSEKAGRLGGDTARTGDPTDPKDIPDHLTSEYTVGGRRRKGGMFGVMVFSSQIAIALNGGG